MSFLETPVFPERISFGITGGPSYVTRIVRTISGAEFRDQLMAQALHAYDAAHAAKREDRWRPLQAFFHIAGGRLNGFRFKDWSDYTVRSGEGAFAPLSANTFQMYKVYTAGTATRNRRIQKPRDNNTVLIAGGTVESIDYATGIVTMTTGTPTSWVGDFDVPCRFDTDDMKSDIVDKTPGGELLITWQAIPIIEIRHEIGLGES